MILCEVKSRLPQRLCLCGKEEQSRSNEQNLLENFVMNEANCDDMRSGIPIGMPLFGKKSIIIFKIIILFNYKWCCRYIFSGLNYRCNSACRLINITGQGLALALERLS